MRLRGTFSRLGPGIIAGAADDDPSSIVTFSIAGARYGNALLWVSWVTWPLMHAVQLMCARVGMVTGRGLIGALEAKLPRPILIVVCLALFLANTINIGADLAGMAEAAALVTGLERWIFTVLFGAFMAWAIVKLSYRTIARVLKWLALCLFAYVVAAVRLHPDWFDVLVDTFTVVLPSDAGQWSVVVALVGSTFSPYFFIWQASQEVEEKRGYRAPGSPLSGMRWHDFQYRKIDVAIGTLFSRVVMFFVILCTSLTLHVRAAGIGGAGDAAEALVPAAGPAAAWLYAFGLLGVGFLVIPVLSASAAYAFAEVFGWRHGLAEPLHQARPFYAVIILSTLGGIGIQFTQITTVDALFWSGVINGVLSPFLLIVVLLAATDRKMMAGRVSPMSERLLVGVSIVAMLAAIAVWVVMAATS